MIYLDYAANSPVDKEVLDLYYDVSLKYFANPNSNHRLGREVKDMIDKHSNEIAKYFKVLKDEIIYTSGATESNNLAIKGICNRYKNYGKHIIISSLEHNSIVSSINSLQKDGFEVDIVPTLNNGLIDLDELKRLLRKDTILVSICSVDSELGILQPIKEISNILEDYPNTYFHTDAVQAIGKVNIDFDKVDLITVAPHKFYGINGIGILIKKSNVSLTPLIEGGKSTTIYRSGTPNFASIIATSKAIGNAVNNIDSRYNYVKRLNNIIVNHLKDIDCIHINSNQYSIPYIINFSVDKIKSNTIVKLLEERDVYVSAKTSCCPVETPSKIVYALTKDKSIASSSIRVSLSHLTTEDEVYEFLNILDECIRELKNNGKI